jgi:release factor glutamine methyltransferase
VSDPVAPSREPAIRRGTSVGEALDGAITAIGASGSATPRLDAELLLADVLDVSRERLVVDSDLVVAGEAIRAFQNAVRRRAVEHEPVAYITGRRAFRYLELHVDRRALIPRPETEMLVEFGLTLQHGLRVLDVGTGSGALALALKHERPDLTVAGSELSPDALAVARANGERLGLEVEWIQADLLAGIEDRFDVILANPPYVAEPERPTLAPEIVSHEPGLAVFAGVDGLGVIGPLLTQAYATSARIVALEVGCGQAVRVAEMARAAGFRNVRGDPDLAGIERVVVAER